MLCKFAFNWLSLHVGVPLRSVVLAFDNFEKWKCNTKHRSSFLIYFGDHYIIEMVEGTKIAHNLDDKELQVGKCVQLRKELVVCLYICCNEAICNASTQAHTCPYVTADDKELRVGKRVQLRKELVVCLYICCNEAICNASTQDKQY